MDRREAEGLAKYWRNEDLEIDGIEPVQRLQNVAGSSFLIAPLSTLQCLVDWLSGTIR